MSAFDNYNKDIRAQIILFLFIVFEPFIKFLIEIIMPNNSILIFFFHKTDEEKKFHDFKDSILILKSLFFDVLAQMHSEN